MISAKFLWGNVLLGGKLQIGAKNSNFEIFESALYMKSVSMPLKYDVHVFFVGGGIDMTSSKFIGMSSTCNFVDMSSTIEKIMPIEH